MHARTLIALLLAVAPPAAAQFEGTVTMRMSVPNAGPMEVKVHHADGKQAMVMQGGAGMMANAEMRMVLNVAENRVTTFVSMPGAPGGGKFKSVSPMVTDNAQAPAADMTVTKLNTTQTIAGIRCDDYEIVSQGETMRMCATDALGRFTLPQIGGPGQPGASPGWARAFGNRPFFPLKVWGTGNNVAVEVTHVDRTAPNRALFDENTPGYMAMPSMGGRRN
jgi:hypothetical protein